MSEEGARVGGDTQGDFIVWARSKEESGSWAQTAHGWPAGSLDRVGGRSRAHGYSAPHHVIAEIAARLGLGGLGWLRTRRGVEKGEPRPVPGSWRGSSESGSSRHLRPGPQGGVVTKRTLSNPMKDPRDGPMT